MYVNLDTRVYLKPNGNNIESCWRVDVDSISLLYVKWWFEMMVNLNHAWLNRCIRSAIVLYAFLFSATPVLLRATRRVRPKTSSTWSTPLSTLATMATLTTSMGAVSMITGGLLREFEVPILAPQRHNVICCIKMIPRVYKKRLWIETVRSCFAIYPLHIHVLFYPSICHEVFI